MKFDGVCLGFFVFAHYAFRVSTSVQRVRNPPEDMVG